MRNRTAALMILALAIAGPASATSDIKEFPVPSGTHPHDVAPARDGGVWYTAQRTGKVWLPESGTDKLAVIRE